MSTEERVRVIMQLLVKQNRLFEKHALPEIIDRLMPLCNDGIMQSLYIFYIIYSYQQIHHETHSPLRVFFLEQASARQDILKKSNHHHHLFQIFKIFSLKLKIFSR